MEFNSRSMVTLLMPVLSILVLVTSDSWTGVSTQTDEPELVALRGRIIDLTCAVRGKAMTGIWNNVAEDHMMEDGNIQKGCATLCLLGGQPAAVFSDNKIQAVLACNPRGSSNAPSASSTLGRYISNDAEVRGYWADGGPDTGIFVPLEIRRGILTAERRYGSGGWRDLDCGAFHE